MSSSHQLIQFLQKRIQTLEDKDAIRTLLNEYCVTGDNHDWAGYANVYTEDAVMTFEEWGDIVGRSAIQKASSCEDPFEGLMHIMTNMEIQVDGSDKASATSYLWFCATPKLSRPEVNYAFGGPYKFTFVRREGIWKVTSMRLKKIWAMGEDTEGLFRAK